jgi:hypothetical protein
MFPLIFWNVPAEIRRVDDCTSEWPCLKKASDHAPHRERHHDPEPPPIIGTVLAPGTGALRINAPA